MLYTLITLLGITTFRTFLRAWRVCRWRWLWARTTLRVWFWSFYYLLRLYYFFLFNRLFGFYWNTLAGIRTFSWSRLYYGCTSSFIPFTFLLSTLFNIISIIFSFIISMIDRRIFTTYTLFIVSIWIISLISIVSSPLVWRRSWSFWFSISVITRWWFSSSVFSSTTFLVSFVTWTIWWTSGTMSSTRRFISTTTFSITGSIMRIWLVC